MSNNIFSNKVIEFNKMLANVDIDLPEGFKLINPFTGSYKNIVKYVSLEFYNKFYNDTKPRIMILGSSPARRGTALTGVPYEDAEHLFAETGIKVDGFHVNKASSNFLYEVIDEYGGCQKFYSDFYMNFICPIGIVRVSGTGKETNCNYYDNKKLQNILYDFIIKTLKQQLNFNIDRSICFCIGSGENYKFLMDVNTKYGFFDKIIPLEHPRFIMQYNSKDKDKYLQKYLYALRNGKQIDEKEAQIYGK